MLKIVSKNAESGLTVVKRSNPNSGEVYEYQVHTPDNSTQQFFVEARFDNKREADEHISLNAESRKIWLNAE